MTEHGEYESLGKTLKEALERAANGKGSERHGSGEAFEEQPIMTIARMCGIGFQTGQIQKKAQEASRMFERTMYHKAQEELLDIIVYAAAGYLFCQENKEMFEDKKEAR